MTIISLCTIPSLHITIQICDLLTLYTLHSSVTANIYPQIEAYQREQLARDLEDNSEIETQEVDLLSQAIGESDIHLDCEQYQAGGDLENVDVEVLHVWKHNFKPY